MTQWHRCPVKMFGWLIRLLKACLAVSPLVVVMQNAHAQPFVLSQANSAIAEVKAARCPAGNERGALHIELDPGSIAPGSSILITAEPSGRVVGSIAPYGIGPRGLNS